MASHRKVCKKWLKLLFEANHFSLCLSAKRVTFNIRSRNFDPRYVGQFRPLQYHSNFELFVSSVETTTKIENTQWKRKLWHSEHRHNSVSGSRTLFLRVCLQVTWKTKLLLVIQGRSYAKLPPFSKTSLNLAQFDGKCIGICKSLLTVLRLKSLRFP